MEQLASCWEPPNSFLKSFPSTLFPYLAVRPPFYSTSELKRLPGLVIVSRPFPQFRSCRVKLVARAVKLFLVFPSNPPYLFIPPPPQSSFFVKSFPGLKSPSDSGCLELARRFVVHSLIHPFEYLIHLFNPHFLNIKPLYPNTECRLVGSLFIDMTVHFRFSLPV